MTKLYDPKCEELARHFLSDPPAGEPPCVLDEEVVAELAGVIQQAIEDWDACRLELRKESNNDAATRTATAGTRRGR